MCIKSDFEEIILKLATYGQRVKAFLLSSKFCPNGLSAPSRGYIHVVKHEKKNAYKIGLQSIFLNLQQMGSDKGFLVTSKVCPHAVICPCPGAIYIYKIIKNVYKIRFLFLNLQRIGKVIRAFCWHQKFVPKGLYALAPGLYTCIKSLQMCIKSDFEVIILKLATNGQSDKGFLLTSTFVPKGLSARALGLY